MDKSKYKWVKSASSPHNCEANQSVHSFQQHTNPLRKISQFKSVSSSYQPGPPNRCHYVDNKRKLTSSTYNQQSSSSIYESHHQAPLPKNKSTKSFLSNYKLVKTTAACVTKQSTITSIKDEFIKNKRNFKLDFRVKKSPKQFKKSSAQCLFRKLPAIRSRYKIDLREKRPVKGPKHRILYTTHKKRILSLDLKKCSSLHERVAPPISKQILNYHYRSSVQKAKQNLVIRKKLPCIFFNLTGVCKSGNICRFRHDPSLIRLCSKFLKGSCMLGTKCPLSHVLNENKLPICSFYIRGQCVKPNCVYLHVKHSPNTPECLLFQKGLCRKGKLCSKRHVWKKQNSNVKQQSVSSSSSKIADLLLAYKAATTAVNQQQQSPSSTNNEIIHEEIQMSSTEATTDPSWRYCKGPAFIPLPDPDELDIVDI